MKYLILSILFLLQTNTFAQTWKPMKASVTFKIKHALGSTANGSFTGFSGTISFSPENISLASMQGTVDSKTIDTGFNIRDKELKSVSYFDVEKYPKISMVSTKFEKTSKPNEYIGYFNLTIKQTTKNIKIPIIFSQNKEQATFSSTFSINRLDFGVGEKSSLLADIAVLKIVVIAQQ